VRDNDYEEIGAIRGAKRLGVSWCPWMGDWFTSWSPRNGNNNAEGTWFQWAHLAARILAHPFTQKVAPELYRPDLRWKTLYAESDAMLAAEEIEAVLQPREDS
jgi:hypothetical protein